MCCYFCNKKTIFFLNPYQSQKNFAFAGVKNNCWLCWFYLTLSGTAASVTSALVMCISSYITYLTSNKSQYSASWEGFAGRFECSMVRTCGGAISYSRKMRSAAAACISDIDCRLVKNC